MGIPVFAAECMARYEKERGAPVLACLFANRVADDRYVREVAYPPDLTPQEIDEGCEEVARRFVEVRRAHPRSNAGHLVWLVAHPLSL